MKLCKDCKYYKRDWFFPEFSKCWNPEAFKGINNVTGKKLDPYFCESMRNGQECGVDAKLFEAR